MILKYFLEMSTPKNNLHEFLVDIGFNSVSFGNKIKAIYYKVSSDPIRVFFEYTLLILIGQYLNIQSLWFIALVTILGVLGWTVLLYSGVMKYIFLRSPIIRSDIEFAKIGWNMNYNNRYWIILSLIVFLIISSVTFNLLSTYLLFKSPNPLHLIIVAVLLSALALTKVHSIKYERFIDRTVISVIAYLMRNFNYSNRYNYLFDKDKAHFESLNQYRDLELTEKPNIYFLSVESYGAVAIKDESIHTEIKDLCKSYESKLSNKGYYMSSCLSTSPVSGGGSSTTYCIRICLPSKTMIPSFTPLSIRATKIISFVLRQTI